MEYYWYFLILIMVGQFVVFILGLRRQAAQRQRQIHALERIAEALEKR